jgi:hypothetical protein
MVRVGEENRIPKIGERVTARGHPNVVFLVIEVYSVPKVVDLQIENGTHIEHGVPWILLDYFD